VISTKTKTKKFLKKQKQISSRHSSGQRGDAQAISKQKTLYLSLSLLRWWFSKLVC